jgi:hypothetical protein
MNRIRENHMAYGERDLFAMRYLILVVQRLTHRWRVDRSHGATLC